MNIGISQRVDKIKANNELRDALDQRMNTWVIEAGFVPVPIPNSLVDMSLSSDSQPNLEQWLQSLKIDALLLSGGNNIGEIPIRDLTENSLLTWAEKYSKPVLGICRGMQMMGVYAGGRLIKVEGHVKSRHKLQFDDHNREIFVDSVNSYHNQVLENCPNSFKVLAKSEDGSIEAMVHKSLPWEAWMWHPEREEVFVKTDQERFKKLMNSGK
jgi:putative glutamine amidotransferase